jgi:protein-S-isoprenylcysteine O-methyltransferase Ste14
LVKPRGADAGNPVRLLLHVPVPWVFVLSYLAGVALQLLFPAHVKKPGLRVVTDAGIAVFAAGVVIAGWAWALFHRARTTTVPGKASLELVKGGPYRITRNPMYIGLMLAYLGEAGILKQLWPLMVLPFAIAYVNWVVVPLEEARLQEVFQDEYERYREKVRRWI